MAVRGRALVPSTASRVWVRLEGCPRDTLAGHLYCPYTGRSLAFNDVMEFVNRLDGLFDEIAFPLAAMEYRAFRLRRGKKAGRAAAKARRLGDENMEFEHLDPKDANTFVVHVQFRRNATWQGTVKWAGQNQEQRFRSTLELLKIMDSAINTDGAAEG